LIQLRGRPYALTVAACISLVIILVFANHPDALGDGDHPSRHQPRPPAIKGNPAAEPDLPPRLVHPGRVLMQCDRTVQGKTEHAELLASGDDFDDGKQSFFLKQGADGRERLYPVHGHFLNGGKAGVFMIHEGKGSKADEAFKVDQSVNMGLVLFRSTGTGLRATIEVLAEDETETKRSAISDWACRMSAGATEHRSAAAHVKARPHTGAISPSHWYRESDLTILTCVAGEYRLTLRVATVWPAHLGFLVLQAGDKPPVGYNVHLLEAPGRLLIHVHSVPHRTREKMLDTTMETETVIGGLLLNTTEGGYAGWVGLAGSTADPYNISFSRDATMADYAATGYAVIPPLPVTCK